MENDFFILLSNLEEKYPNLELDHKEILFDAEDACGDIFSDLTIAEKFKAINALGYGWKVKDIINKYSKGGV